MSDVGREASAPTSLAISAYAANSIVRGTAVPPAEDQLRLRGLERELADVVR